MGMTLRTKRVVLGFTALILIVVFLLVVMYRVAGSLRERQRYEEERAALMPPPPNVHVVEARTHHQDRRYSAQLLPWMRARVPAEVTGRVVEIYVEAGTAVEAGAPLVRLDDRLARIAVESTEARHAEARRLLEEGERLVRTNAVSRTEYEARAAAVRLTEAALAEAREVLERHTVRAPFHGTVNDRQVDIGDAVRANDPVAEVVDLDKLRVVFFVSEQDLGAFEVGKPVALRVEARPGEGFEPTVDFVSRSADERTRLFKVEAVLENENAGLPGGLQGVVEATIDLFKDRPFVPVAAVRFAGRHALVLVQAEGAEEPGLVEIEVGPELNGYYPVLEGLAAGDRILVR